MKNEKNAVHHAAIDGYSISAGNYVRGRPDYPPETSNWLQDRLGLHPGMTVVDLGAGTGKFTPRLLETGATVIAIEPVAEMLDNLSSALPQVKTIVGSAESVPLSDASVDAVICAQSFHWFATPVALAEIHRILKPGGRLGLIWNVRDERIDWVVRLSRIVNQIEGDTPRYHTGVWRRLFPFPGFGPLHEQHFSQTHTGAPEDVILNRVRSISFIAALPPEDLAKIDDQIKAFIASEPALSGKALVTFPYETAAFDTVKSAD